MEFLSTTAEMERNIEMQNERKEKEEADLKLMEEEEKKQRELFEKAENERKIKEAKEKKEKDALEKKDREEKRRLERRLESERREREEKERIEKETRDREDEVMIERFRLERENTDRLERKGRLERRQSKDDETKNERDEHDVCREEFETAEFITKREKFGNGTLKSNLEHEAKAAIDADRLALKKVREEIERKIRVESIQGGKGSSGHSPSVPENDANAIGLLKASMREIDKGLILQRNLEIENEKRKKIENEIRIQDEQDRRMREEKEKKIREEIERNIQEDNQRKSNIENQRKLQEENERKLISEKKKMIERKNELRKLQENERRTKAEEERKLRVETEWKLREESAGQVKYLKEQKIKEDNEQRHLESERRKSFEDKKAKETEQKLLADQERRRSFEDRLRLIQATNSQHSNEDNIPTATALHSISEESPSATGSKVHSTDAHGPTAIATAAVISAQYPVPLSSSPRHSPRQSPMQTIVHTVMLSVDIHTPPRRDYNTKSQSDKTELTPSSPHTVVDGVSPKNQNQNQKTLSHHHSTDILPTHPGGYHTLAPFMKILEESPSPPEPVRVIDHIPSDHMELLASRSFMPISAAGFSDSIDRCVDRSRRDLPTLTPSAGCAYRCEGMEHTQHTQQFDIFSDRACILTERERSCGRQSFDPESLIVKSDDDVLASKQRQILKYQSQSESVTSAGTSQESGSSTPCPDMSGRESQSPSPKPLPIARKPCKCISETELDTYVKL